LLVVSLILTLIRMAGGLYDLWNVD
jgi:hypothetical protein